MTSRNLRTTASAVAQEPAIWLRVEINQARHDHAKVSMTVPLSLIEVVIENVDPSRVMTEIKTEKGIDLAKMWRQIRNMDLDEFITVDTDEAKVKVYKDTKFFRVTVQEEDYDSPNVEMKIPFPIMDYMLQSHKDGFKFSELVESVRGSLPMTLLEANHDEGMVKVWLEEK
jgi:hypothetical protein